jgi:sulfur carrier protein
MNIKVNGKALEIKELTISIAELLRQEKVESPDMVSIQLNDEFVDKGKYGSTYLKESDEIEFLYFMGGGSIIVSQWEGI